MASRARAQRVAVPRRGEAYLVRFGPPVGAEMRKTRPALIVQNDIGNRVSPIVIVAAISSQVPDRPSPIEVVVAPDEGGLHVHSVVLLNYLYSLDRRRLVRRLGALRPSTIAQVNRALAVSLGLTEL